MQPLHKFHAVAMQNDTIRYDTVRRELGTEILCGAAPHRWPVNSGRSRLPINVVHSSTLLVNLRWCCHVRVSCVNVHQGPAKLAVRRCPFCVMDEVLQENVFRTKSVATGEAVRTYLCNTRSTSLVQLQAHPRMAANLPNADPQRPKQKAAITACQTRNPLLLL